jgi:hypothetical protein
MGQPLAGGSFKAISEYDHRAFNFAVAQTRLLPLV